LTQYHSISLISERREYSYLPSPDGVTVDGVRLWVVEVSWTILHVLLSTMFLTTARLS